jgi:hypothetical protein
MMDDEVKILWILSYVAKAARGEISKDCSAFAYKSVQEYTDYFDIDLDQPANDDWQGE